MFDSLKTAKRPMLMWSAGLDSTLILAMLIEAKISVDIVQQGREFWTKAQKKRADDLIKKRNLKVLSYAPASVSFIGKDDKLSLVREYAFMGTKMPMVSDIIEGDRCIADLEGCRVLEPPMKFDVVIVGSRKDDRHWAFEGDVIPQERWTVGETEFFAPLYDKSREWVQDELRARGLDADEVSDDIDGGTLQMCHLCLDTSKDSVYCPKSSMQIPTIQWDKSVNLAAFQSAYGI